MSQITILKLSVVRKSIAIQQELLSLEKNHIWEIVTKVSQLQVYMQEEIRS